MSNELISTENFQATATGLQVGESVTYDEWLEFGERLARVDGAIQWWIGDWAAAGDRVNVNIDRKVYDEIEKRTGLSRRLVQNCAGVAKNINSAFRNAELSWTHHVAVAALSEEEQARWLATAQDEGLSVAKLRRAIKAEGYLSPMLPDDKYRIIYIDPPWLTGEQRGLATSRGIRINYKLISDCVGTKIPTDIELRQDGDTSAKGRNAVYIVGRMAARAKIPLHSDITEVDDLRDQIRGKDIDLSDCVIQVKYDKGALSRGLFFQTHEWNPNGAH